MSENITTTDNEVVATIMEAVVVQDVEVVVTDEAQEVTQAPALTLEQEALVQAQTERAAHATALNSREFAVIDPGTAQVRFHIPGLHLRSELYGDNYLGYDCVHPRGGLSHAEFSKVAMFSFLSDMVPAAGGPAQLRKNLESEIEDEEDVHPIYPAMLEQLAIQETEVMNRFSALGSVSFSELPFLLKSDQVIVCTHQDSKYAGEVQSAVQKSSMFGEYIAIKMRVIVVGKKGVVFGNVMHYVGEFKGRKSLSDLGMQIPTDAERAALIERGRRFIKVTTKPTFMMYKNSMVRQAWYGPQYFRGQGRVIVDITSMATMDPNYSGFFGISRYDDDEDGQKLSIDMSDKQLLICSPYVYGFSLGSKVWGEIRVEDVSDIEFREDAFDKLALDARYKRMLNAQVSANDSGDSGDIIAGKGGGLIYMLHGDPGIGKTLTAEAIAEKLKRPLYSVSTGELGTEPDVLDERLKNILDMAATWNAILLIDEADIFLECRSEGDVHRNAMVGIFLKLLEYYEGILFLTTNRAKNIDPAFFSRISLAIKYPNLDFAKRKMVWTNLLKYAGELADDVNVDELAKIELNGRQIKHIVRQARTLARYEEHLVCKQDLDDVIELVTEFNKFVGKDDPFNQQDKQLNG